LASKKYGTHGTSTKYIYENILRSENGLLGSGGGPLKWGGGIYKTTRRGGTKDSLIGASGALEIYLGVDDQVGMLEVGHQW
jgi:hypothetical protein